MEYQTSNQWAETIAESVVNGQNKQAIKQLENALHDGCYVDAVLQDMAAIIGHEKTLVFACRVIESKRSK